MVSRQIVLILLGIIILGFTLDLTNDSLRSRAEESKTKDNILRECTNLGFISLRYYNASALVENGGKSFSGWKINSPLDTTSYGTYFATVLNDNRLLITGKPLSFTGFNWVIQTTVNENTVSSRIEWE